MSNNSAFHGFPNDCVKFFIDLRQNNNKQWFVDNRAGFDNHVMEPARQFVVDMGERLKTICPDIIAEPKVNRSIFKINRDVRFSQDKSPYKTHLALWFWEGLKPRMECSGFYFHLEPPILMLGVGIYSFPKYLLEEYRNSLVHAKYGAELAKALEELSQKGSYSVGGKHYKKIPKGFDSNHKNADYLLYNGFYAGLETHIPDELFSVDIIDYCYDKFKEMIPVHIWLLAMTKRVSD